ncbi:hypothetical protein [Photobacterium leiognathi]|uniref:hypothetical protein n=1 Tax=Photobacterium leiognathi TaxID=553611 RepID=UPI002734A55D|nr:hypothetical protein [Photobacterium leiognathi]
MLKNAEEKEELQKEIRMTLGMIRFRRLPYRKRRKGMNDAEEEEYEDMITDKEADLLQRHMVSK